MAILLFLVLTLLHRIVDTFLPCLHRADRLESLLLALVTDLPGLLLAVLGVAVLLGFADILEDVCAEMFSLDVGCD